MGITKNYSISLGIPSRTWDCDSHNWLTDVFHVRWFSTFTNLKKLIEFLAERTLKIIFNDKLLHDGWHII